MQEKEQESPKNEQDENIETNRTEIVNLKEQDGNRTILANETLDEPDPVVYDDGNGT